jgi:hypothetical protein
MTKDELWARVFEMTQRLQWFERHAPMTYQAMKNQFSLQRENEGKEFV